MYIQKTVKTKHKTFVTKTKCFYYNPEAARGRRGVRRKSTGEGKESRNKHNAYLRRKYQIYNNFDIGDMWVTLTYKQEQIPQAPEEAHKNLMLILGKIQRNLKKQGIPFTYYVKTEAGDNSRVHHHLIIKNNFNVIDTVYSQWKQFGKVKDFSEIYSMADGKLVKYFLDGGEHKALTFEKYAHSRNLKEPETQTKILPFKSFRTIPKPPPADEDGTEYRIQNLYNGFADIDGYIYQEYEIIKTKSTEREEKKIE